MTKISTMIGLIVSAAVIATPVVAQTVPDNEVPTTSLNIPGNVQLYGDAKPNVYRPSATVNGEIITATDIEQRMALIRIANNNVNLPPEEEQRLRQQVFSNLIDEKLQIQEAKAAKIEIDEKLVDDQFARLAARFKQSPDQFAKYLTSKGSSAGAVKQQIRGEYAWDRLLQRNIQSSTNVSTEEVEAIVKQMNESKGLDEFHLGEIYLSATPETAAAVAENAQKIIQALQAGGSFQAYARQFSEASTAVVGGDLGWVKAAQLPPTMAEAAAQMAPGQLVGPVEVPGGISIMVMIDRRQVLTADPRDAVLSLKQVSLDFPAGTTEAQATELAGKFAEATRAIAGCGGADSVAAALGAHVVSRDNIQMRALPPPLQATLASMQIGQTTQPFGAAKEGISVLVLCGRDMPQTATAPDLQEIENRLLEEKVNKRAQRYLRDLRRDAVIEYS
ncbi:MULTISPECIES: peptidylprolyl isomerase [unclassified Sphingopyxis]|uniref:peptidylprolyl isomerase n=1 Tax=unclassified Sphingopyxis TaxID=2614943 RepID=UPI0007307396|nr:MULTISPECIES: peptidylprolyl isomerase [unclassified Sphingopyxis]KTE23756.1 peptidylprolyl isomerase [Sphingopyxis sp. H057]KTE50223.1 peptidylprolyl isomerase [Sphingopyxis sp. H073]KTE50610.1 peptidylprolyl isomerase [Sphingopyxis sp. H071]KTE59898.1 peptidylprolyl isomerase [Sphingopyxis sp. H107]KTE63679.1 peptidylprolyl isomerase [Sphingopyxis sp. H100]